MPMKVLHEQNANNVIMPRRAKKIFFMQTMMTQASWIFNRLIFAFGHCFSAESANIREPGKLCAGPNL